MRFEININKKYAFTILVAILILVGILVVVAYGGTQPTVMGHSVGELDGVQATVTGTCLGQVVVGINPDGSVNCEMDDAVGGALDCTPVTCTAPCTATCPAGYWVTGGTSGGPAPLDVHQLNYPSGNGWACPNNPDPFTSTCYASCCRVV